MTVLGSIISAIFHHGAAKAPTTGSATAAPNSSRPSAPGGGSGGPTQSSVDVEAVLTRLASENKEKLDWRRSIVDLMKLLKLDSSLSARKQLAKELHYSGDMDNSTTMNVWLHKQVMVKLAENGGKVPDSLRA